MIIPNYVCQIFVNITPRLSRQKSKNLCTQCLYPGARVGAKHKCLYLKFCCSHSSHGNTETTRFMWFTQKLCHQC